MSALLMIVSRNPQPGIQALLANNGYRVRASPRVLAQEDDEEAPAAIIADFDEPFTEGPDICRQLRRRYNVPLVAMSQPDESFEVALLDAGADDYVARPCGTQRLLARIRLALRRNSEPTDAAPLNVGVFEIDFLDHRVRVGGRPVRLTPKEFDLFVFMARRPNRVLKHRAILSAVWGEAASDRAEYLRVFMGQLRRKLEAQPGNPRYLLTEPWVGYRFSPFEATPARGTTAPSVIPGKFQAREVTVPA